MLSSVQNPCPPQLWESLKFDHFADHWVTLGHHFISQVSVDGPAATVSICPPRLWVRLCTDWAYSALNLQFWHMDWLKVGDKNGHRMSKTMCPRTKIWCDATGRSNSESSGSRNVLWSIDLSIHLSIYLFYFFGLLPWTHKHTCVQVCTLMQAHATHSHTHLSLILGKSSGCNVECPACLSVLDMLCSGVPSYDTYLLVKPQGSWPLFILSSSLLPAFSLSSLCSKLTFDTCWCLPLFSWRGP